MKVLILAYDFPPYVSVAGLRPESWLKFLKNDAITPTIITRQWDEHESKVIQYIQPSKLKNEIIEDNKHGKIIRTPYTPSISNRLLLKGKKGIIQRSLAILENVFQFYTTHIGSKKQLYKSARKYIRNNKDIDCIIATGDPFVLFYYASKLGKEFNIPWIADYRDPWSDDYGLQTKPLQQKWTKNIERRIVGSASSITVVPDFLQILTQQQFNKPIFTIPNGFDDEKFIGLENLQPLNQLPLKIGFAGTIVEWDPIEKIIDAIQQINKDGILVTIDFYGTNKNDHIVKLIKDNKILQDSIHIHSRLPNQELLTNLKSVHFLLLFNYYSIVGTKIYDYLALKRPILFCFTDDEDVENNRLDHFSSIPGLNIPDNIQSEIVLKTKSGILVKNYDELIEILKEKIKELKKGNVPACDSVSYIEFSRKFQTHRLAVIIKQTISHYNAK